MRKKNNDIDEQSREKIIKHKGFVIDKDSLNKSKIGTDKFEINKNKVEESLKRSVSSESSIKRSFKKEPDKPEYIPTFRDYSGKIKYDSIKNNANKEEKTTFEEAVKTDSSNVVKSEDNSKVIKATESDIISDSVVLKKETTEGNAFKYQDNKNIEKVIKASDTAPNIKPAIENKVVINSKNSFNKVIKKKQNDFISKAHKGTDINQKNTEYINPNITYKDNKANNSIIENKGAKPVINTDNTLNISNSIVEYSVESSLSKTAKSQVKNNGTEKVLDPENKLLKNQIKKNQQEKVLKSRTQVGYKQNKPFSSTSVSSSIRNVISDFEDDSSEAKAISAGINVYEGAKIAKLIAGIGKNSFDASADFAENVIYKTTRLHKNFTKLQAQKKLKINNVLSNKPIKNIVIDKSQTINKVLKQSSIKENSSITNNLDKHKLKVNRALSKKVIKAVVTDTNPNISRTQVGYKIEMSDNKKEENPRKKKKFNPKEIAEKKKKYGIIDKKDSLEKILKSDEKIRPFTNNIIKTSVKNVISSYKEDSAVANAANKAINYYETAKATTLAVTGGIRTAEKLGVGTVNTYQKLKKTAHTVQRLRKLTEQNRKAFIKKQLVKKVKAAKAATKEVIKAASKKFILAVAGFFLIFILMIAVVGGIITAFTWQTSTDLDTTLLLKVISDEDYKMQKKWFDKGKTMLEIKEQNDHASQSNHTKFDEYNYYLAVDVPPDNEPAEDEVFDESTANTLVEVGTDSSGHQFNPQFRGFNESFSSSDEMLENYRWTTDDYRAALAYLQVKNDNLGWFSNLFGIGEAQLKASAKDLHKLTYKQNIVIKNCSNSNYNYQFVDDIYSASFANDTTKKYYYFGRKFSVKYLIDNDYVKFDENDEENNKNLKEQFENVYNYGNIAVANLTFPLELDTDEKIEDRISKHFGTQLALSYEPPTPIPDEKAYGTVSAYKAYHYANDLSADKNDKIYAPISGLCKVFQRDERGFEYVISTAYNDNKDDFDFSKDGYLIKISCSSASYLPTSTATMITKGAVIGKVADNISANYKVPDSSNDTNNEDIFANYLFPCSTSTRYSHLSHDVMEEPEPDKNHIHIEMYKLPCDFNDISSIQENVLAPELFFEYPEPEN